MGSARAPRAANDAPSLAFPVFDAGRVERQPGRLRSPNSSDLGLWALDFRLAAKERKDFF